MLRFRIPREAWDQLQKLLREINAQSEEMGAPGSHTVSSLARHWLLQRLENGGKLLSDGEAPTTLTRHAPNVLEASERLRGVRK